NTNDDTTFEVKEPKFEGKKTESQVHVSPSSSAKTKKHDDKTKKEAKGSSHVNAASTPVPAVGQISTNNTNTFSVAGLSNTIVSPTLGESSYVDLFQYPDDPNMPALEDITYSDDEEDVGIDHEEVFALVARMEAIRLFLAYASFMGFMVYQIDAKSAFLYGTIKEEVYFDDIIFGSTNKDLCKAFEKLRKDTFQMSSMGELTFFLDGKSASTPIDTEKPLLKDLVGEDVDVQTYRSMIGSLMYLTLSIPDIMFAVCAYVCFQVTPKASHLHAVKRIFRYLKGKPHLGLWYPKDSSFNLVAYSDSDYAGASLDRKSTTGDCQFLGCRLISWQCKKQTIVATSLIEAE
nr:hypothetical protein [Tanacetum cinerariifolium]